MEQEVVRYRGYVLLCSVISFVVGGALVYFTTRTEPSAPLTISTPPPTPTSRPTPGLPSVQFHVAGAVRRPDVYELPKGSIVKEAIEAAGGLLPEADTSRINLAQELCDHQRVYVPFQGEENPPPLISGGEESEGAPVNINTATAAKLETLPRIGPATAQNVIEYREANGPFEAIEEIQDVPNIGPATFEGIKDLITVGP